MVRMMALIQTTALNKTSSYCHQWTFYMEQSYQEAELTSP